MFLGEYQHTLDAKGRLSLPSKFRSDMTGSLVVSKGIERCLYVQASEEYASFVAHLTEGSDFDPEYRKVRRFFTSGAVESELDSAGRVTVSLALREYAGLDKDVTIIGNGDRIELWDTEHWATYNGETTENIEESARGIAALGFK